MADHGTPSRYKQGCGCAACTDANREYQNERNRKRRAYVEANGLPSSVQHGNSAYTNWGCRCPVCTAAATAVRADIRKRRVS
jgi:hypothetical protein